MASSESSRSECTSVRIDGARAQWNRRDCANSVRFAANATMQDQDACSRAGMNDYLAKPYRMQDLVSALRHGGDGAVHNKRVSGRPEPVVEERAFDELREIFEHFDADGQFIAPFVATTTRLPWEMRTRQALRIKLYRRRVVPARIDFLNWPCKPSNGLSKVNSKKCAPRPNCWSKSLSSAVRRSKPPGSRSDLGSANLRRCETRHDSAQPKETSSHRFVFKISLTLVVHSSSVRVPGLRHHANVPCGFKSSNGLERRRVPPGLS